MAHLLRFLLLLGLLFSVSVEEAVPQSSVNLEPSKPKLVIRHRDCGLKINQLDNLVQGWASTTLLIIVSHTGQDEKSKFGRRRLYNAKTYFSLDGLKNRRSPDLVVTTHGETTANDGYLDFYVKGELELRVLFRKNEDFQVGDCVPDPSDGPCPTNFDKLFYPCKKQ